jgi:hypothetical protein
MPFVDRTPRTIDPWLEWKVRLFVVGAGLGLVAMFLEIGWLLALAGGLLAVGFALRFLTRKHEEALLREEAEEWSEWDEGEEDHPVR